MVAQTPDSQARVFDCKPHLHSIHDYYNWDGMPEQTMIDNRLQLITEMALVRQHSAEFQALNGIQNIGWRAPSFYDSVAMVFCIPSCDVHAFCLWSSIALVDFVQFPMILRRFHLIFFCFPWGFHASEAQHVGWRAPLGGRFSWSLMWRSRKCALCLLVRVVKKAQDSTRKHKNA